VSRLDEIHKKNGYKLEKENDQKKDLIQFVVGQCPKTGTIKVLPTNKVINSMKIWLFYEITKIKMGMPPFTPISTENWRDVKEHELQKRIVLAIINFLLKEEIETTLNVPFEEPTKIISFEDDFFMVGHDFDE
jgi:hypothetical protein